MSLNFDHLTLGHPAPAALFDRRQHRNGLAPPRNNQLFAGLDPLEQIGSVVSQVSKGNFYRHATNVALHDGFHAEKRVRERILSPLYMGDFSGCLEQQKTQSA